MVARVVVLLCFLWSLSFVAVGGTSSGKEWFAHIAAMFFNDSKGGTPFLHISIPILLSGWVCTILLVIKRDTGKDRCGGRSSSAVMYYASSAMDRLPRCLRSGCCWAFGRRRGDRKFEFDALRWVLLPICLYCWGSIYRHFQKDLSLADKWKEAGNAFGIGALMALGFQMIPVARHSVLLAAFKWSPAHAIRLHVWSGRIIVSAVMLHSICHLRRWCLVSSAPLFPPAPCWTLDSSSDFHPMCVSASDSECSCYDSFRYFSGLVGSVGLVAIGLSSLNSIRRRAYWLFYRVHILASPIVLLATILHWERSILYLAGGILYYFATSFPTMAESFMSRLRTTKGSGGIQVVSAQRLSSADHRNCIAVTFEASETAFERYRPGNYVKVLVPSISSIAHPFTVNMVPGAETNQLQIIFRATGPFTRRLAESLMDAPSGNQNTIPVIQMVGFFGALDRVDQLLQHDSLLLVAGGIGITPFLSLVHSLLACLSRPGFSCPTRRLALHWMCRDDKLIDYMKQHYFDPLLNTYGSGDTASFRLEIVLHRTRQSGLAAHEEGTMDSFSEEIPIGSRNRTVVAGGTLDQAPERIEPPKSGLPFQPSKFAAGSRTTYVSNLPLFLSYTVVAWLGLLLVWVFYENLDAHHLMLPRLVSPIAITLLGVGAAVCVNAWYTVLGHQDVETASIAKARWQAVGSSDSSDGLEIVQPRQFERTCLDARDETFAKTDGEDQGSDTAIADRLAEENVYSGAAVTILEQHGRPCMRKVVEAMLESANDPAVMVCGPRMLMEDTAKAARQSNHCGGKVAFYQEAFEL